MVPEDSIPPWMEGVVTSIEARRDDYHRRAKWHRIWFRTSGVVIIVLSAALPALTIPDYGAKKAVISSIGVTLAILTGLRSFYQWHENWSLLRQSDFELSYLLDKWTLETGAIAGLPPDQRKERFLELTLALRNDAEQVRRSESTRFFASLRLPHPPG
jgi:Protein of unknown function (DUF4231)